MTRVKNGVETSPEILTGGVGCTIVTDKRLTDGFAIASTRT